MPVLTGDEKKDLNAVVHDMGERALKQVLFGVIERLVHYPSMRTGDFLEYIDEARKYDAAMKGR